MPILTELEKYMIPKIVTSKDNKVVKQIRSLHTKKGREKENLFIVEGLKFVFSDSLYKPKYLVFSEEAFESVKQDTLATIDCEVYVLPIDVFNTITDTENSQGVICVFSLDDKTIDYYLETFKDKENLAILICEEMQDPGNCGTIIRSADAGGFDICIFTEKSVDYYNPKAVRSSAGSILNIPCIYLKDTSFAIDFCKKLSVTTYGTYLATDNYYDTVSYPKRSAIFLGNEANGLKEATIKMLDYLIKIPILGKAESLNVSIAGSIMIYEILRQNRLEK